MIFRFTLCWCEVLLIKSGMITVIMTSAFFSIPFIRTLANRLSSIFKIFYLNFCSFYSNGGECHMASNNADNFNIK